MEPLISIQLHGHEPASGPRVVACRPGSVIDCDYQIDAVGVDEVQSVEASILWYTEGKGDEDMAVHFFERRLAADADDYDLRPLRRIKVQLPYSPLSFEGQIIKIRWCVRVRAFLKRGKAVCFEYPFRLGDVPSAKAVSE